MRRKVISNLNGFFANSATELRDIRSRDMVEGPEGIFIQGRVALDESEFNACSKKIVLSD